MTMVPEAWQDNGFLSDTKAAFYEYNSCIMEPWDGPAMMAFTDGRFIGATLDRNGLRPSRYYITDDDRLLLSSEVNKCARKQIHFVLFAQCSAGVGAKRRSLHEAIFILWSFFVN